MAVFIGIVVLVATVAIAWLAVRYMRTAPSALPPGLLARREVLVSRLDAIIASVPDKPRLDSHEVPGHPGAGAIEAKLLSGDHKGALIAAENLLVDSPQDGRVHVLLARVLLHKGDLDAAWREITRARSLGEGGPMLDYLEGRAHHLRILRQINPKTAEVQTSPVPSLITPFEMFILQLERQRQKSQHAAAVWLASAGAGNRTIDHDEIAALVADHFASYYDSLDKLSTAAESQPGFAEALYHTARLALKAGFIHQGMTLMDKIAPLMETSAEKRYYDRDRAELRDEQVPAALPPVPETAKRSRSLKVLN